MGLGVDTVSFPHMESGVWWNLVGWVFASSYLYESLSVGEPRCGDEMI